MFIAHNKLHAVNKSTDEITLHDVPRDEISRARKGMQTPSGIHRVSICMYPGENVRYQTLSPRGSVQPRRKCLVLSTDPDTIHCTPVMAECSSIVRSVLRQCIV